MLNNKAFLVAAFLFVPMVCMSAEQENTHKCQGLLQDFRSPLLTKKFVEDLSFTAPTDGQQISLNFTSHLSETEDFIAGGNSLVDISDDTYWSAWYENVIDARSIRYVLRVNKLSGQFVYLSKDHQKVLMTITGICNLNY